LGEAGHAAAIGWFWFADKFSLVRAGALGLVENFWGVAGFDDRLLGCRPVQARAALVLSVALLGLGSIGAWRWWVGPWRAAQTNSRAPAQVEQREAVAAQLAGLGVQASFGVGAVEPEHLRWRAPGDCVEVYAVRVDERHRDPGVAVFLGRAEEHTSWVLALAADPRRRSPGAVLGVLTVEGEAEPPRVRELWWGPAEVGPQAPDWACRRRSWDPMEDALALAWPRLPDTGRALWVGERWQGMAVEGRCHETVCLDPQASFAAASETECRARPWAEQLAGVQGGMALIQGDWDDGHDPARGEIGVLTSRVAVIDEGRPLYVRAVIEQRWAGVRRELSLVRLDPCGERSLASEADAALVDQARARLQGEL
jgi:hypothetical protein